ncbi:putative membrane protein [Flavobacteriaceae bacterium MAR_2010_188]|nr:putative membrane protein [Flavobacteriaceae bacterium MAR_2010_188]
MIEKEPDLEQEKKYNKWIIAISIIVPIAVAALFMVKIPNVEPLSYLPPLYATINGITAVLLIIAFWAIKNKKIVLHENLMTTSIGCSVVFLVMYIAYHMTSDTTPFGGEGTIKYLYYFILITHILLSIIVIPFVLITYVRAISADFERHKKIARITFPLWLYVAVTGVIVYIMISPYYV